MKDEGDENLVSRNDGPNFNLLAHLEPALSTCKDGTKVQRDQKT